MADNKTKVDMAFESELTQAEIGLMYAFMGAVRWVKGKFESPTEPEPEKLLLAKKKKVKKKSVVSDME